MWLIIITVIILYGILILWTNANMYAFDKKTRVTGIVVGVLATFLLTLLLVLLNGMPFGKPEIKQAMTLTNVLLFSAVNALTMVPTIAKLFNKKKTKELTEKQVRNQLGIRVIIFIGVILIEISYLHSFQNMMMNLG